MPTPDESGTYVAGRIFGGQFCVSVSIEVVREGDYIMFNRQGTRVRRVKSVHRGRKHNYAQFEPCRANPFKSQRINLRDVQSVWRPQPTLEVRDKDPPKLLPAEWKASIRRPVDE
jgi:hypothetical protein